MAIRDDLKKTLVEAAKARDQVLLDTIRAVQSAIRYKEIDKKGELTDTEVFSVIQTLSKQRRESVDQYTKGGRTDLATQETRELEILQKMLPAQASVEEVEAAVKKAIVDVGAKGPQDMGKVMKPVLAALAGKVDGKIVSELVKKLLS
ncbi:MAG: GatB/YqeY domain-containing protein [Deltaproteobacteria bacterium]|nr:MAG: GatB/YqeY domain-containing protein [Deltaproteobacteria bacterium]